MPTVCRDGSIDEEAFGSFFFSFSSIRSQPQVNVISVVARRTQANSAILLIYMVPFS